MIREMKLEELPIAAQVYEKSFIATHKDFLPESFMATISYQHAKHRLESIFASTARRPFCFVAVIDNNIIGFAIGSFAIHPPPGFKGELKMLYVLPEYQGRGIGKQLVKSVVQYFVVNHVDSMFAGTFKENVTARTFYEGIEGVKISEQIDHINGDDFATVNYGWPSIETLFL